MHGLGREEAKDTLHRETLAAGARPLDRHRHRSGQKPGSEGKVKGHGGARLAHRTGGAVGLGEVLQDPRSRGERLACLPRFRTALRPVLGEDAAERDGVFERSRESRLERRGIRTVHRARILERRKVDQVGTLTDCRAGEPVLDRFTAGDPARRRHRPARCPPGVAHRALRSSTRSRHAQRRHLVVPERVAVRFALDQHHECRLPEPVKAIELRLVTAPPDESPVLDWILVQISPDTNGDLGAGAVAVGYAQRGTLVVAQVREVERAQERLGQLLPRRVGGNRCTVARLLGGIIWGAPGCRSGRSAGTAA